MNQRTQEMTVRLRRRWLVGRRHGLKVLCIGLALQGGAAPVMADGPLAGKTVRIAFIDPLSGPLADVGRNGLRSWQFMAERKSGAGNAAGVRFLVAGFDNKGSPQESLNVLKVVIDQGFRYIVQGNSSGAAAALSDAVTRHNAQQPDKAVVFINYAAMDPALTNEKCSFWHFRIDADTSMKMRALTRFLKQQPDLKKVYLLNQNYAHGQQVALYFRQEIARQQADVTVVDDVLHAPFQVEDFRPYVQRIKESGAQAVITGNWGVDMRRLVQAMQEEGVNLPLFAYYPNLKGTPTALARAPSTMSVYQIAYSHTNQEAPMDEFASAFRKRYGEDLVVLASYDGLEMLGQAMQRIGSTDAARVAARLSGMIFQGFNGPVQMRADDHQLQKGVYISRWQKVDAAFPQGAEGTDHTFVPVQFLPGSEITGSSRCHMQRP
ncbi:branched-chain amino acid transport system substrate-binding protein [Hydrogenophaga palleronii]|uniref:Branched-chain amino acid transport system substrate-binding protein n=1 Tax=Hydrogenophaga palleronii TaxID=65655 RepID=A0ABU1WQ76_9BURK|nr:branched-chain amino acid ABC transporter substrate-binding protein [Hydrogenophaga palleronii]MDR7151450.1 branched-chain amino acid transport system substrate-binding protein [Hydrogenophaga palleronii]